jgi:ribonuclease HIII
MATNAPVLPKDKFRKLRDYLKKVGFKFEERPHQVFLARAEGLTVSLYESGKIVIGGKDRTLEREVRWYLTKLGAAGEEIPESLSSVRGTLRIGTDEVGKGDYFGPLVVAGVLVDAKAEEALTVLGARDSKKLSAKRIMELAPAIMKGLGRVRYEVLRLDPPRYNGLYAEMENLNRMLSWAHARVIENLLARSPECRLAVVDQFSERALGEALMEKGRGIKVVQSTGGERDIAVAAASILARDAFVRKLDDLGTEFGMVFPKGSSAVEDAVREFVKEHGAKALAKVAKLHFATTKKVVP